MARLGTAGRPGIVRVRTEARAGEIVSVCDGQGWQVIVGVEPDQAEDVSDVERLLDPPEPVEVGSTVGRNDPCPCESGRKYKKCCGSQPAPG